MGGIGLFHQGQLRTSVEWVCRNHTTWRCLQFLVCPLREVSCQVTVVAWKPPVEIGKPQELLQLLQVRRCWPLRDGCDLHLCSDISQERHLTDMQLVSIEVRGENQNVI